MIWMMPIAYAYSNFQRPTTSHPFHTEFLNFISHAAVLPASENTQPDHGNSEIFMSTVFKRTTQICVARHINENENEWVEHAFTLLCNSILRINKWAKVFGAFAVLGKYRVHSMRLHTHAHTCQVCIKPIYILNNLTWNSPLFLLFSNSSYSTIHIFHFCSCVCGAFVNVRVHRFRL